MSVKSIVRTIFPCVMLLLSSCMNLFFPAHPNLWLYTYSNGELPPGCRLTPASFVYLGADKKYTLDFGTFQFGTWRQKSDTLLLFPVSGKNGQWLMKYPKNNELEMQVVAGVVSDFSGSAATFGTPADNPFSVQNNQWRIPATAKETSRAIRERLINHCAYWKAYFKWALDNSLADVDVRGTPTPLKIYGNGFELKPIDDLPEQWLHYFYDTADCRLANGMISDIFRHQNIAWPQTDNRYKMFVGAFEQLENLLRENGPKEEPTR